jgi:hypothetical protein
MTRKDYRLIASILKNSLDNIVDDMAHEALSDVFAEELANTNPRFNREKFLRACGAKPR